MWQPSNSGGYQIQLQEHSAVKSIPCFLCSDTNVTQFGQGLLSLLTCACTCMREKFDYWHLPSSTCFYVVSMGFMRHTENFISVCIKTQLLSSCPVSQTLLILLCILLQCLERKKLCHLHNYMLEHAVRSAGSLDPTLGNTIGDSPLVWVGTIHTHPLALTYPDVCDLW